MEQFEDNRVAPCKEEPKESSFVVCLRSQGQAMVEYLLLLAVIVTFIVSAFKKIDDAGIPTKIASQITGTYARTYQFGHPKASYGSEGGGETKNHPRAVDAGENNFRIFILQPGS